MPQDNLRIDREWFERHMSRAGLSQRRVAQRMGIHFTALSRTLSGQRKMRLEEVRKIAPILGVSESEVLAHAHLPEDEVAGEQAGSDRVAPRHPAFGCMKGMLTPIDGYEPTEPSFPDWEDYAEKKYGSGSKLDDE